MVTISDFEFSEFKDKYDEFPTMQDLTIEQQEYINKNGVTDFNTKYPETVSQINPTTKISKVFLQAFHINWLASMIKSLYQALARLFTDRGVYSSTTQYYKGDRVTLNNVEYLCSKDSKGISPTNTAYWSRLTGLAGAKGKDSVTYYIDSPTQIIIKQGDGSFYPSTLTVNFKKNTGGTISNVSSMVLVKGIKDGVATTLQSDSLSSTSRTLALSNLLGKSTQYNSVEIVMRSSAAELDTISIPIVDIKSLADNVLADTISTTTVPINRGGTNATNAIDARWNLGLGDASTYGVSEDITSDISDYLATEGAVFNFVNNVSKSFYIVAASDSDDKFKQGANIVCDGISDQTKIQTLINTIPDGSEVKFLGGHYKFSAPLILNKPISLIGSGKASTYMYNTESGYVFSIRSSMVDISNMNIIKYDEEIVTKLNPYALIELYSNDSTKITLTDVTIKDCVLDFYTDTVLDTSIITTNTVGANLLENLYQFRMLNCTIPTTNSKYIIDFAGLKGTTENLSAIVGGKQRCTRGN